MLPSDPPDDHGLYQPPRPPLPAPTPYTHPRPPHSTMTQPTHTYTPHPQDSTIYYAPRKQQHEPQPLPNSRYPPFQPQQHYRPPPNPRVGAAGLPPSMTGPEDFPLIRTTHPRSPLGGPGSLSCPTSLSEQAASQQQQQPPVWTPRTIGQPALSHTSLVVPPRAPPSIMQPPHSAMQVATAGPSIVASPHPPSQGQQQQQILPSTLVDHPQPPPAEHELKTRSLPTRCSHKPGRGGIIGPGGRGNGTGGRVCEEDGFFYSPPLVEEGGEIAEDFYGSSEDLSSGGTILEKLMVWAYYSDQEEDNRDDDECSGEESVLNHPLLLLSTCACYL